jgi:hypothetical protein
MFPRPEAPQPENKVVQFPFPEKVEDFRDVHVQELDEKYGRTIAVYVKMKALHLNRGRYHDLEDLIVTRGKISPAIFEEYLKRKKFTWDMVTPIGDFSKDK